VFELRNDKLPGGFGDMIAAVPGLRIPLQLFRSDVDGLTVCFPTRSALPTSAVSETASVRKR
jgi:hypothetical protein